MLTLNTQIKSNQKFTTASLGCFLRLPLTRHNLAYASLLARMQMNSSLYYPSIKSQQDQLAKMYDLQFEVLPQLFGKELVLSYIANFVEPLELMDPDYTYAKIVEVLASIIQHPNFDDNLILLAKNQLLADYREIMEEPSNYALDCFFKLWYENQPDYADNFMGPVSEIKAANSTSLKLFSENLRTIPTCVLGIARDHRQVKRLVEEEFKQAGLMKEFTAVNPTIPANRILLDKEEVKRNIQSQLLIGYGYHQELDLYGQVIGMVLAQYLAGDQSSILFTKIREELGAAYAVEANNYANNALFLISAGLEPEKAAIAKKIIRQEIAAIASGQIDENLFKKAKKSLVNIQLIGSDQENWQMAQMLRAHLFKSYDNFDRTEAIKKVTITQMRRFVENLFLNESYVLK